MTTLGRKIRVAMVVNNFDVGGLEKVVVSLLTHLDRQAFEPFVVCLDGEGKMFGELPLPPEARLVLRKDARLRLPFARVDDRAILRLRAFVTQNRIDILHAHNLAPLLYAGLATRFLPSRPRVAYTEHNQIYRASRLGRAKFLGYQLFADELATCSKDLERFFRERLRLRRPVRVLYNGIDGRRYAAVPGEGLRRELGFSSDDFVVGTAVVLSEQKGIRYLIDAAKRVCAAVPNGRFVVAGDGPLRAELEALGRASGLGDRLKFLGFRRDIPELISSFDVYALSSLWEGLPLALLEALAIGKPIVATRVGGNPEIVDDGVNGFIVPPRDPEALAAALIKVARDDGFRARVRDANVAKFAATFSLEAMLDAHARTYEEMLARPT